MFYDTLEDWEVTESIFCSGWARHSLQQPMGPEAQSLSPAKFGDCRAAVTSAVIPLSSCCILCRTITPMASSVGKKNM